VHETSLSVKVPLFGAKPMVKFAVCQQATQVVFEAGAVTVDPPIPTRVVQPVVVYQPRKPVFVRVGTGKEITEPAATLSGLVNPEGNCGAGVPGLLMLKVMVTAGVHFA
jgi:hypothetical protein